MHGEGRSKGGGWVLKHCSKVDEQDLGPLTAVHLGRMESSLWVSCFLFRSANPKSRPKGSAGIREQSHGDVSLLVDLQAEEVNCSPKRNRVIACAGGCA